ncbi:MAG TPA: sugar phosphate isomerase/epimerase family protein [Nitrososphaeraceae archaeon]|nr:sugar phosphate isomerase/epimerase family protein [Nitrososphaeraceae archaeon]
MSWEYSITLSSFKNLEPIQVTLEKLKHQGFSTVEVYGDPDFIDVKNLMDQFDTYSIKVSGVTGMWGLSSAYNKSRNLVTTDNRLRLAAQNYVKKCVTLCHYLGGKTFNICLFSDKPLISDGNHKFLPVEMKRKLMSSLVKPLRELVEYASDYGIDLVIEPLNRYSTPICTTSEDAKYIVNQLNHENMGIMLDTFHMNIEEDSIYETIVDTGSLLRHIHVSDNNRKMPGFAHIDFDEIVRALKKIKYSNFIAFEPTVQNINYEKDLKTGLNHFRNLSK